MRKISIPKDNLYKLYWTERKSPYKIAKIYKCDRQTIANRLREYKIPLKSQSQARMHYSKYDFTGNLTEKAYLIGFRLGDMWAYRPNFRGETIVVQCHTTRKDQLQLIKNLFKKYGHVGVTTLKNESINIFCYLNTTFSFLLPKNDFIEPWIYKNKKFFIAFLAGYIDAEGSFGINQGRAKFKIDSYDKRILLQTYRWLNKNGIYCKFFRIGKKRQLRSNGSRFNKDLWRLNVNKSGSLERFIYLINPFIRHRKRKAGIKEVLANIRIRKKKGTIK